MREPRYYAEVSPIPLVGYEVTVWTNIRGIRAALSGLGELLSTDGDGEHMAFNYRMYTFDDVLQVEQIVEDCARVENMLEHVEVFAR